MVWGLEISVIYNHVLGSDQGNAGAPVRSAPRYADCKDYLYCFSGLAVQFVFCLPGKPLRITKKYNTLAEIFSQQINI